MVRIDIGNDEKNLSTGLMGLVLALVEIIRDALRLQAMRRVKGGRLSDEEVERLGKALKQLDLAIEKMKEEHGLQEAVKNVREGLDNLANDAVQQLTAAEEIQRVSEREAHG